jgi:hypothetical protein
MMVDLLMAGRRSDDVSPATTPAAVRPAASLTGDDSAPLQGLSGAQA